MNYRDPRYHRPQPVRRRVIIIEETAALPAFLRRLVLFCSQHPLPQPMRFQQESIGPEGQPVAIYQCGDPRCRHQEAWEQDPVTGRPRQTRTAPIARHPLLEPPF